MISHPLACWPLNDCAA